MEQAHYSHQTQEHERNYFAALIVTILFAGIFYVTLFQLGFTGNILLAIIIIEFAFFFSVMIMLLEPRLFRGLTKTIIQIKEIPIEKPVYIEKIVEKPIQVIQKIPVVKRVYVEAKRKKLNIPKYNFVASTETKTYHTRNCRLGKLIKKKYKLSNNSKSFFKKKRFKSCKVCIQKTHKV